MGAVAFLGAGMFLQTLFTYFAKVSLPQNLRPATRERRRLILSSLFSRLSPPGTGHNPRPNPVQVAFASISFAVSKDLFLALAPALALTLPLTLPLIQRISSHPPWRRSVGAL